MILDYQNLFSDGQNLTATAASTNLIDLGAAGSVAPSGSPPDDAGAGNPLTVEVVVTTTFTGTSPTLIVALQTDDNASFSSAVTLFTSQTIAAPAKGNKVIFSVGKGLERYIRLYYTLGGTSPNGVVTAGIVLTPQTNG